MEKPAGVARRVARPDGTGVVQVRSTADDDAIYCHGVRVSPSQAAQGQLMTGMIIAPAGSTGTCQQCGTCRDGLQCLLYSIQRSLAMHQRQTIRVPSC